MSAHGDGESIAGDVLLRPGHAGDVDPIITLIARENHRPADPDRIRRRLAQLPSVIAERDGRVVAFLYCRRFSPDMVELSNMVVAAEVRRGGVGARMVAILEPQLVALGFRAAIFVNCRLHVGATDAGAAAARAFWLHRGYRIIFSTQGSAVFAKFLADAGHAAPG